MFHSFHTSRPQAQGQFRQVPSRTLSDHRFIHGHSLSPLGENGQTENHNTALSTLCVSIGSLDSTSAQPYGLEFGHCSSPTCQAQNEISPSLVPFSGRPPPSKLLLVTPELAHQLTWWTFIPHLTVSRPFSPLQLTFQVTTDTSPTGWDGVLAIRATKSMPCGQTENRLITSTI